MKKKSEIMLRVESYELGLIEIDQKYDTKKDVREQIDLVDKEHELKVRVNILMWGFKQVYLQYSENELKERILLNNASIETRKNYLKNNDVDQYNKAEIEQYIQDKLTHNEELEWLLA